MTKSSGLLISGPSSSGNTDERVKFGSFCGFDDRNGQADSFGTEVDGVRGSSD